MQIEFLGSGGAITTPRPGCACRVCAQARERGVPYSRSGPCTFVHGPNILIDTPEEIKDQLNRSRVQRVDGCFYSHWHPDHTMGRRVWEMNYDWRHWPPQHQPTDIYLPQQVAQDFRARMSTWDHLAYMQKIGVVRLIELADGDTVEIGGFRVTPFRLAEDYVYAFLFEGAGKRALVAPDELFGWEPPDWARGLDLAVIPMGLAEFDVFSGERQIPADHPILRREATFRQSLEIARKLGARRVVMTHIEEPDAPGYDDLRRLEQQVQSEGLNLTFAYDTMMIDV
jgi:phosphoribosyl 1,2-cyclic phosphate phosphodiesterase